MQRIKLIKAKSYSDGVTTATAANPEVAIDDDSYAAKLLASGYFAEAEACESEADTPDGGVLGHLDEKQLENMSMDDLRKLAADMGVDTAAVRKKNDLITAITEIEVQAAADAESERGNE